MIVMESSVLFHKCTLVWRRRDVVLLLHTNVTAKALIAVMLVLLTYYYSAKTDRLSYCKCRA